MAETVFVPLTVGGGVRKVEDIRALLNAGADKVVLTRLPYLTLNLFKKPLSILAHNVLWLRLMPKTGDNKWKSLLTVAVNQRVLMPLNGL